MNKKAFTLIELLVAITVLSTILCSGFCLLSAFWRTENKIVSTLDKNQSVRFVMDKIISETRNSVSFDPLSTQSELILVYDEYLIKYDYKNGKVRRRKGGGSSYLTEVGRISSVKFEYPSAKIVKILLQTDKTSFESFSYIRNQVFYEE